MPEDAVMTAEPVETGADDAQLDAGISPGGEDHPDKQDTVETGLDRPATDEPPILDGKRLSSEAKKTLDEIHARNPKLAAELKSALFERERFRQAVPGGLREVQELRQTLDDMGGSEGLQGLNQEIAGWRGFDESFTAGDPKALDFIISTPEGKDAFAKLAPAAFDKYAELDHPGFESYVARTVFAGMNASGVPLALARLADFIGENPQAVQQYQVIANYVKYLQDASVRQNAPPKTAVEAKPDSRLTELEQQNRNYERTEWKRETAQEQSTVFNQEWNRILAGRKITDTQAASIRELFNSRLDRVVRSHADKLERFFSAKDKAGFLRYASGITKNEIPKALRAAFDAILPGNLPGKITPPNGRDRIPTGQVEPKNGVSRTVENRGFHKLNGPPENGLIDVRHPFNTTHNYVLGRAVLRDGRKVAWK